MYGSGREEKAMTAEECGARFMLAWEGPDWEEESDEEESDAVADLVPSAKAEVVPSVEVNDSGEAPESGVGAEVEAAGFSSGGGSLVGRPPCGLIMVEPSAEELRRWEGTWRPIAFACRKEAGVGGGGTSCSFYVDSGSSAGYYRG